MSKKICIFTGTRAEYGLLKPLIDELIPEESVHLQLIITGMHLSPEFGYTFDEIDTYGIDEFEKVEILLSSDSPVGVSKAMGLGMISFAETLQRFRPDLLIGLGDRFELLSVVAAATVLSIPVAHLHGGELTEGAIDESFRHAITKMSHFHFASTEVYKNRIMQMGENPEYVFNVGAIGLDNLKTMDLLSKEKLEKEIGFKITENTALVTFHPVTTEPNSAQLQFSELLKALSEIDDFRVIFTKPNADASGRAIIKLIDDYVRVNPDHAISFFSMGHLKYLSVLKYVSYVIGNSSSGIIEAPSLKTLTVNIGDRQKGRVKAESIIDCNPVSKDIKTAIEKASEPELKMNLNIFKNPYEISDGFTSKRIKEIILSASNIGLTKKKFFDLK
jgi:GDP/UDP-N,N'-diacetylbacillosamine 2-epimerase (hydrolysing)